MIENLYNKGITELPEAESDITEADTALEFNNVRFRYERNSADVLRDISIKVYSGEVFCILGGNGCGKTTSLSCAAGLLRPYSGTVRIFGKKTGSYKNRSLYHECLAMLPQDVQTVFIYDSVREELEKCGADMSALPFDISHLLDKHPYDLSGGEQQLAALARVLAAKPRLLLMDEPTKGLDADFKQRLTEIIHELKSSGMTVVIVTHDVEFAAECSDRCAMFFDGNIVSVGRPVEFFSKNCFYTTAVSRMTRGIFNGIVTVRQAEKICRLNMRKGHKT